MDIKLEKMIAQGNTAEVYSLPDNKILKLFRNGMPRGAIEREYQNGLYVQKVLNCVPKVYEMIEEDGRFGIVYQEINGKDMLKIMISSSWKLNRYARKFAHYHLHIQKQIEDGLCTLKEKLIEDIRNVELLSDEKKKMIIDYLMGLPDGNALCHFDFHPGNIMIDDNEAIILDWMTACQGDSCADVARTCIMLKYGGVEHAPWIVKRIISLFQKHICKIYLKEYLRISKREIGDITKWELPVAAARLREWIADSEKSELMKLVNDRCEELSK